MNKYDSCRILGLTGELTLQMVKNAYRLACKKYHPDRNPAGLEMMKLVNSAYEVLKALDFAEPKESTVDNDQPDYGDVLNAALNAILDIENIFIEVCGVWIWVSGDTRSCKDQLKEAGYKFAGKKKQWYFRPAGFRSKGRGRSTMDDIRNKYGSVTPARRAKYKQVS